MPIYEYACRACGERFELLQKHSDPPVTVCRSCAGPVDKLVSQTAFQLKGSGWYVTDYARKDKDKGKGGGKPERAAGAEGGSEAAKPAEKATASDSSDTPARTGGESAKVAEPAAKAASAAPANAKT